MPTIHLQNLKKTLQQKYQLPTWLSPCSILLPRLNLQTGELTCHSGLSIKHLHIMPRLRPYAINRSPSLKPNKATSLNRRMLSYLQYQASVPIDEGHCSHSFRLSHKPSRPTFLQIALTNQKKRKVTIHAIRAQYPS